MNGSYIFNKVNLYVIAIIIIIFTIAINEIAIYFGHAQERLESVYAKTLKAQGDVYRTQETCQERTVFICDYRSCDYLPTDPNFESVCGKNFRPGWKSGIVAIPAEYQNIETITLNEITTATKKTLEVKPTQHMISFGETIDVSAPNTLSEHRSVEPNDVTQIMNRMIIYGVLDKLKEVAPKTSHVGPLYELTISAKQKKYNQLGLSNDWLLESKGSCFASECPSELLDINQQFQTLWKNAEFVTTPQSQ